MNWRRLFGRRPVGNSFDHLVGASGEHRRHVETQRLRGLKVDHQLVLGRLLYRQVRRLCTTKNAIDVSGRPSPLIDLVDSIGNEAALSGMKGKWIDRRQTMVCRQFDSQLSSGYGMRCNN